MSETHVVSGRDAIDHIRRVTLKGALKMELAGMNRGSRQSAYAIIKAQYGLKGNRQRVYDQFVALIEEQRPSDTATVTIMVDPV
tara:strand:- start:342 stop:593 length:252 start_codon:yes stop_codon:yes gene_type:complete